MAVSLELLVIVLFLSFIAVAVCRYFKIPSMQAYLIVGFIAGPSVLNLIMMSDTTTLLGEIGIVFLMFSIGLEFSLAKLKSMKSLVCGFGGLQVLLTQLVLMGILYLLDYTLLPAFLVAGALTMSSTAIVSRLLAERTELATPHGQMSMGILLMQDIAVVPLMILLPVLAGKVDSVMLGLLLAVIKMVVVLFVLLVIGQRVTNTIFRRVAKTGSSELFMVTVLLFTLGISYLTSLANLSLSLGAFIAGMLISETQYHYQVQSDIRPFRDVLLGFFFMTIGMKLQLHMLLSDWSYILLLVVILILVKAFVIYVVGRFMKYSKSASFRTAMYLAQAGEFGFVLLSISDKFHIISGKLQQVMTVVILMSMIIGPMLLEIYEYVDTKLSNLFKWHKSSVYETDQTISEALGQSGFVLIIGFGRTGQGVARILTEQKIPYYALDLDAARVAVARTAGEPVQYGDACRKDLLESLGLKDARMVVITIGGLQTSIEIINHILCISPKMSIIARASHEDYVTTLVQAGADHVVSDTQESSLMLSSHTLLDLGRSFFEVYHMMRKVRYNHYKNLQGYFVGDDEEVQECPELMIQRYAFTLPADAYLIGHEVDDELFNQYGVELLAIRRHAKQLKDIPVHFKAMENDTFVLMGTLDTVFAFENWALQGEI